MRTLLCLALLSAAARLPADELPREPELELRGVVLDAGKPVADVLVSAINDPLSRPEARTDAEGRFRLHVPLAGQQFVQLYARTAAGDRQALFARSETRPEAPDALQLALGGARKIAVRIVNGDGRPVPGALARAFSSRAALLTEAAADADGAVALLVPAGEFVSSITAYKPHVGFDYGAFRNPQRKPYSNAELDPRRTEPVTLTLNGASPFRVRVIDEQDRPLAGVKILSHGFELPGKNLGGSPGWLGETTNDEGWVDLPAIPRGMKKPFTLGGRKAGYTPPRVTVDPLLGSTAAILRFTAQQKLTGIVVDAAGKPAAGAEVSVAGGGGNRSTFRRPVLTNAAGEFELPVDVDKGYAITAARGADRAPPRFRTAVRERELAPVKLTLEPGTTVTGTLIGVDNRPLKNEPLTFNTNFTDEYLAQPADEHPLAAEARKSLGILTLHVTATDDEGRFAIVGGRGKHSVRHAQLREPATFELTGQRELLLSLQTDKPAPLEVKGRVVAFAAPDRGLAEAEIMGVPRDESSENFSTVTDANGAFTAKRPPSEMLVAALSADRSSGAFAELGAEDVALDFKLQPTATVRGKLVDEAGKPAANQRVQFAAVVKNGRFTSVYFHGPLHGITITNAAGEYELSGLIVGGKYNVQWVTLAPDQPRVDPVTISVVDPKSPELIDLKEFTIRPPMPAKPLAIELKIPPEKPAK